jgi:hypothetical protein
VVPDPWLGCLAASEFEKSKSNPAHELNYSFFFFTKDWSLKNILYAEINKKNKRWGQPMY